VITKKVNKLNIELGISGFRLATFNVLIIRYDIKIKSKIELLYYNFRGTLFTFLNFQGFYYPSDLSQEYFKYYSVKNYIQFLSYLK